MTELGKGASSSRLQWDTAPGAERLAGDGMSFGAVEVLWFREHSEMGPQEGTNNGDKGLQHPCMVPDDSGN